MYLHMLLDNDVNLNNAMISWGENNMEMIKYNYQRKEQYSPKKN